MQQGQFISFEGTEGVGKTTAIEGLCQRLNEHHIAYVRTREPGGSAFAERLRQLLLDPDTDINDDTELLLMFAARSDHLQQIILPALHANQWVICDRFIDSTVAYQGYGRGFGEAAMLIKIEQLIAQFVTRIPDVTFWLDLPIAEGLRRANKRGSADRFEQQALDFFARVHQGFAMQQAQDGQRIQRIDASGDADSVGERVWQTLIQATDLDLSPLGSTINTR